MFTSSVSIISPLLLVAGAGYAAVAVICYYKPLCRFLSIGGKLVFLTGKVAVFLGAFSYFTSGTKAELSLSEFMQSITS